MDAGVLLDLLGNENRRRILQLLSHKPCYVTEISEHLGVSPKAVIDHLRQLEEAGLVESRTDDRRRKYFNICENLRLEVTLAPYGFGMKSAYAASSSLDLSRCNHLSIEIRDRTVEGPRRSGAPETDPREVARLARELDELEDIERELSLAQRWVQGRIAEVLDGLANAVDGDGYLDAEILAVLAGGATDPEAISREVQVPPAVVEERLGRLQERGVVRFEGDEWTLLDA